MGGGVGGRRGGGNWYYVTSPDQECNGGNTECKKENEKAQNNCSGPILPRELGGKEIGVRSFFGPHKGPEKRPDTDFQTGSLSLPQRKSTPVRNNGKSPAAAPSCSTLFLPGPEFYKPA